MPRLATFLLVLSIVSLVLWLLQLSVYSQFFLVAGLTLLFIGIALLFARMFIGRGRNVNPDNK